MNNTFYKKVWRTKLFIEAGLRAFKTNVPFDRPTWRTPKSPDPAQPSYEEMMPMDVDDIDTTAATISSHRTSLFSNASAQESSASDSSVSRSSAKHPGIVSGRIDKDKSPDIILSKTGKDISPEVMSSKPVGKKALPRKAKWQSLEY